jgi:hypothetical protein
MMNGFIPIHPPTGPVPLKTSLSRFRHAHRTSDSQHPENYFAGSSLIPLVWYIVTGTVLFRAYLHPVSSFLHS